MSDDADGPTVTIADRYDPTAVLLAVVALVGGGLVLLLAVDLFPHHSSNHDEGVYLQQARLLLDGALWFETDLPGAFRWWFFVEDGSRLYGKYQPVVPALFAVGLAVGAPRLVLGVVGAGVVALVGLLAREAYDGPTGVLAGVLVVASPLFLLSTSVFLPYAPTALLNLLFAYAYVRLVRSGRRAWSVVAGVAVGLAFFARPYTAVLFAAPFVVHAVGLLVAARGDGTERRWRLVRLLPVAALGTGGVALALAYNAVVTGDPLRFPFSAFAPRDGVGFGHRALLGYAREYTVPLALEANGHVLWEFATRFVAAPPVGALLAALGVGLLVARSRRLRGFPRRYGGKPRLPDAALRLLVLGVFVSVIAGNVAFWGNLNVLADPQDPTEGFVARFGPFYHYDLLLPLSAFGGAGLAWLGRRTGRAVAHRAGRRRGVGFDRGRAAAAIVAVLLVATPVLVVAEANALGPPLAENRAYTDRYESAYAPFQGRSFDEALVFVPTPYGEWLGHPFQALRNDPGLDGDVVYALDRSPGQDFAVLDAYPDRTPYRFAYHGDWNQAPPRPVTAHLQPIEVRDGRRHQVGFETGVVGRLSTIRLSDGDEAVTYDLENESLGADESVLVEWVVEPGRARVISPTPDGDGDGVTFDGSTRLSLAVTYVQSGGASLTYRQELAVEERGDAVRLVWPARAKLCRLTEDCGDGGTYVPGGDYVEGVVVDQRVRTDGVAVGGGRRSVGPVTATVPQATP